MENLAPFTARNERENKAMIAWVHAVLDEYYDEYYYDDELRETVEECRKRGFPRLEFPCAIKQARQGNVTDLRKLVHPEVAEFIQPPKLSRGEKYKKPHRDVAVRETAKLIRRIWRAYYGKRRRHEDGASAEEIAAEYHGLNANDVSWKPGGRHKKKAKAQNQKQQR
jgi:hypothetical protein